jgi:hypothetical protein
METSAFGARRQKRRRDNIEFVFASSTNDRLGNQKQSNFAGAYHQRVTSGEIVTNKTAAASANVPLAELVS